METRGPLDRAGFKRWLDRYIDAWRLVDATAIGDLFSPDARYSYDPFGEALVGRDAIVADWLREPDDPNSWRAEYDVLAIDGDTYVAHGRSRYLTDDRADVDREFANIFVCRFDAEGRCREFTEWYMRRPPTPPDSD
jgi:SnoaL-like protein